MTSNAIAAEGSPAAEKAVPAWTILLLAAACGLVVANLYYAQPLIGPISASLGLAPEAAGLIVTMAQIGYGVGLLLIVPLGDLVENRRLVITAIAFSALSLAGAAVSTSALPFLVAALCIGLSSVAVQILVPFAAHLASDERRGQALGSVMSGLMLGIMLARPAASFITNAWSWHAVFVLSAMVMAALAGVLHRLLPTRRPAPGLNYGALLKSMGHLFLTMPTLRRRSFYQACLFGAFTLFWTTVPLLLAGPEFGLSQAGIAWFALAGVAGAVAAPIAGRLADGGWIRTGTLIAMLIVAGSFLLMQLGHPGLGGTGRTAALAILVASAIVLDFGVSANIVFGQRVIFALGAEYRSRLNGVFMATIFVGGGIGSAVGAWAYAHGGWTLTAWIGFAMPVLALAYFATERKA